MTMRVGQKFRCQNLDCRSEVVVVEASVESVRNPRCCCGDEMKKQYCKPTFKKQSFRRLEIDDLVETQD
jgi:hypothetical protein